MTFLTVDTADQDTVGADGVSKGLNEVFIAAILLAGCSEQAERAVVEAIETLGDEEGPRQPPPTVSWLPIQLRGVLLLPRDLRHAFVLRLLLALPQRHSFTDRSRWATP